VANPDTTGLPGATTGSVLGNDTLSGIPPVNPADVILTTTISNPALTKFRRYHYNCSRYLQDLKH
jgi:hypothetical protein